MIVRVVGPYVDDGRPPPSPPRSPPRSTTVEREAVATTQYPAPSQVLLQRDRRGAYLIVHVLIEHIIGQMEHAFDAQLMPQIGGDAPDAAAVAAARTLWMSEQWSEFRNANIVPMDARTANMFATLGQSLSILFDHTFVRLAERDAPIDLLYDLYMNQYVAAHKLTRDALTDEVQLSFEARFRDVVAAIEQDPNGNDAWDLGSMPPSHRYMQAALFNRADDIAVVHGDVDAAFVELFRAAPDTRLAFEYFDMRGESEIPAVHQLLQFMLEQVNAGDIEKFARFERVFVDTDDILPAAFDLPTLDRVYSLVDLIESAVRVSSPAGLPTQAQRDALELGIAIERDPTVSSHNRAITLGSWSAYARHRRRDSALVSPQSEKRLAILLAWLDRWTPTDELFLTHEPPLDDNELERVLGSFLAAEVDMHWERVSGVSTIPSADAVRRRDESRALMQKWNVVRARGVRRASATCAPGVIDRIYWQYGNNAPPIRMRVDVVGAAPTSTLTYRWVRDNDNEMRVHVDANARSDTLTLPTPVSGRYRCEVTDSTTGAVITSTDAIDVVVRQYCVRCRTHVDQRLFDMGGDVCEWQHLLSDDDAKIVALADSIRSGYGDVFTFHAAVREWNSAFARMCIDAADVTKRVVVTNTIVAVCPALALHIADIVNVPAHDYARRLAHILLRYVSATTWPSLPLPINPYDDDGGNVRYISNVALRKLWQQWVATAPNEAKLNPFVDYYGADTIAAIRVPHVADNVLHPLDVRSQSLYFLLTVMCHPHLVPLQLVSAHTQQYIDHVVLREGLVEYARELYARDPLEVGFISRDSAQRAPLVANARNVANIEACEAIFTAIPAPLRKRIARDISRERLVLENASLIESRNRQMENVTWVGRHSATDTQPEPYDALKNVRGTRPKRTFFPLDELHSLIQKRRASWVNSRRARWQRMGRRRSPYVFETGKYEPDEVQEGDRTRDSTDMMLLANLYSVAAIEAPSPKRPMSLGELLKRGVEGIRPVEQSVLYDVES